MNKKYLIVCGSTYGSTLQSGRWLGQRLERGVRDAWVCPEKLMQKISQEGTR